MGEIPDPRFTDIDLRRGINFRDGQPALRIPQFPKISMRAGLRDILCGIRKTFELQTNPSHNGVLHLG